MNVLSLFDGISCGRVALDRAGIKVDSYWASEVDKYAIEISEKNFPDEIARVGDVTKFTFKTFHFDLLIGGSPCQGFSFAGKQLNFDDPRSKLFFEFVRILKECRAVNPDVKFLLENVRMKQEFQDIISEQLGVKPIMINSSLVSAQNRVRLYWTNIKGVVQPEDKEIYLKDIIEKYIIKNTVKETKRNLRHERTINEKALCCSATMYKGAGNNGMTLIRRNNTKHLSTLTPLECERLQTLPDNYTDGVSNSQRYKMLGNGWTVDIIAHIFKGLK